MRTHVIFKHAFNRVYYLLEKMKKNKYILLGKMKYNVNSKYSEQIIGIKTCTIKYNKHILNNSIDKIVIKVELSTWNNFWTRRCYGNRQNNVFFALNEVKYNIIHWFWLQKSLVAPNTHNNTAMRIVIISNISLQLEFHVITVWWIYWEEGRNMSHITPWQEKNV